MIMTFASRKAAVRRPDIALSILGFALVILGVISVAAVKQRRVKSASTAAVISHAFIRSVSLKKR